MDLCQAYNLEDIGKSFPLLEKLPQYEPPFVSSLIS